MMFLLRMLMRNKGGSSMDPLHVSMTGVRMGERFLQIGCYDKALLAGLAAKVGLSGTSAVAAFDESQVKLARSIGAKVGALIEVEDIDKGRAWPYGEALFDMVVIDNTGDEFRGIEHHDELLRNALRTVRPGGRIEAVTRVQSPHPHVDFQQLLTTAGFKPVRLLAERNGFRFVEGLRPNS